MLPPKGLEYDEGLQLPAHTGAISPLKEFTSRVVEDTMTTRISGEAKLGVISIVDNEGLGGQ